jgi:hypothetical protein
MTDLSLRCAALARSEGYSAAGTAATAAAFVLVEVPLPWPHDVGDHPLLAPLKPVLKSHGGRLQALVPDGTTPDRSTRVVVYRRPSGPAGPDGPFDRFTRHERIVATERLVLEVGDLLDQAAASPAAAEPDPDGAGLGAGLVDVLVCTHGKRDVCCGSTGTRAYSDLVAMGLPGVRLWRTSHTGGHRFAPTAMTFPDGRAWASVDAALLAGIVTRSVDATVAAPHDRGCAAFADAFAQAADGAVLAAEGWSWLDGPRRVEVAAVDGDDDRRQVTLTGVGPGDSPLVYRAEVVVSRVVPVPDCGKPLDQARKSSREVEVVALERSATGAP